MKATEILIYSIFVCLLFLFCIHFHFNPLNNSQNINNENDKYQLLKQKVEFEKLLHIIHTQNETITMLSTILEANDPSNKMTNLINDLNQKDKEIESLYKIVENNRKDLIIFENKIADISSSLSISEKIVMPCNITQNPIINKKNFDRKISADILNIQSSSIENECEKRYGLQLIDLWRDTGSIWCKDAINNELNIDGISSELKCYQYHQEHKKLDGRGPDIFCEATNFIMDFSKITGEPAKGKKPALGSQYLNFQKGALYSTCKKTNAFKSNAFMPHHSLLMSSFETDKSIPNIDSYVTVDTTTYVLARDEDCENSFHSTADFMNMFLVMAALDINPSDQQVMLFDKHPEGPYIDLIKNAFSPNHPVIRHTDYKNKVLFKKLIFHLESPAGLIFPKVSRPDPLRCFSTSFFQAYRKFILQSFDLYNTSPPPIPTVTLSLRHRSASKNVGRILENEAEVIAVLNKGNMMDVNVVDMSKMSYLEQLKLVRNTNVLVGVHGAGLMFIMFAADEAVLVEMHPSYRQDRHFRHAARMTGKIYMPLRSLTRETCVGSSDNVKIPIDEFRKTMDGALRIARSFDDGLSECGLICPSEILALDDRLNKYYKSGETHSKPVNTRFPC